MTHSWTFPPAVPPAVRPAFVPAVLDLGDLLVVPWDEDLRGLLPQLVEIAADPEVARWNPVPLAEPGPEAWLAKRAADWASGDSAGFAVLADGGRVLCGTAGLHWSNRDDGQAGLGYRLAPAARGRGVATRAAAEIARWGFGTAGVRRMEIAHAVGNPASCRIAERCGFPLEGTLRASHLYGDGVHHDEHLHARLATDPGPVPAPGPAAS